MQIFFCLSQSLDIPGPMRVDQADSGTIGQSANDQALEIETEITRYNSDSYNDLVLINGDQGQPLVRINTGNVLTIYYINT